MNTFQNINGMTVNSANAGLTLGTTNTFTTTAATNAAINGVFATALAAQTNAASPVLDWTTGVAFVPLTANQTTVLVWGTNGAGVMKICQGQIIPTETGVTTTAGAFINAPQFPATPDDFVPIGYNLVRTSPTGSSFVAGTTSWAASGITCSVPKNVHTLPLRPVIA